MNTPATPRIPAPSRVPASPRITVLVLAGVLVTASAVALAAVFLVNGAASGKAAPRKAAPATVEDGPESPVPYVRLATGTCFDHPGLSDAVTRTERRACDRPHDGEVVAERRLHGDFRSEQALRQRAMGLCAEATERRLRSIPQDGRGYRPFVVHPSLGTYEQRGEAGHPTVACALTLDGERAAPDERDEQAGQQYPDERAGQRHPDERAGAKLTARLP